ncbi:MAG TPA: HD domain-containing phosphohydrolase [Blastocatellia bacterium]|nr:HD domain-containing phosphohydrolase [Blastocatellia bacterium]
MNSEAGVRYKPNPLSKPFHFCLISTAAAAVVYSIFCLIGSRIRLDWLLLLMSLLLAASRTRLGFFGTRGKSIVTNTFIFVGVMMLGTWAGTFLAGAGAVTSWFRRGRRPLVVASRSAALTLAVLAASLITTRVFGPLDALARDKERVEELAVAIGLLALSAFLIGSSILAASTALRHGRNPLRTWLDRNLWTAGALLVSALAAGLICKAIVQVGFYAIAIAAPILLLNYITHQVYVRRVASSDRHIERLTRLHLATIESLALAIDAKDQMAQGHIGRVRRLAEDLARAVNYPEDQMEGLRAAALLHDIGKLAVPEQILNKPGKLSPAEFSKVMVHPVVAADILSSVDFPYEVVPIVKHHHEKFDGSGYPSGLAGEQIPLGARILSIVDCYDALNSTRPYRPRYSLDESIELMRRESGRSFDPHLLNAFLRLIDAKQADQGVLQPINGSRPPMLGSGWLLKSSPPESDDTRPATAAERALTDIAAAQREVLSLYEISQTLGSTLRLSEVLPIIAAKLENIANFTTLVLYLADGSVLKAAYVTGKNADALKGIVVPVGEGEAGWVAEHRQALIGGTHSELSRPLGLLQAHTTEVIVGRAGVADLAGPLGQLSAAYRSTAIFPLLRGDALVGALALYSEQDRGYSADEVRLLETISGHAAVAVFNALAFERTQESALTDNLTGLPNSRYMYSFFDQERSRAERQGYPLVLMMMDLDGFKKVNDTYGHHIGDEILRRTAKIVRRRLRMGDTLIRYAGDEFVAVLHHATPEIVQDLKRRLQGAVDSFTHEVRPGRIARVGISIGHATYGEDGVILDELMEVADSRMYDDKAGRKLTAAAAGVVQFPTREAH